MDDEDVMRMSPRSAEHRRQSTPTLPGEASANKNKYVGGKDSYD